MLIVEVAVLNAMENCDLSNGVDLDWVDRGT